MTNKTLQCRDHGGTFVVIAKRGRPPVRCSDENPCSRAPKSESKRRVAEALQVPEVQQKVKSLTLAEWRKAAKDAGFSAATINKMKTPGQFRQLLGGGSQSPVHRKPEPVEEAFARVREEATPVKRTRKPAQAAAEVETRVNPSVPKAHAAKALLEPQGWKVTGRGWFDKDHACANIVAVRGEENLGMLWVDGGLDSQSYSLWSVDKPSANNTPAHKLPFDPDEMTDAELVRAMSGMKVTWWNRIASATEDAVVAKDSIKITHNYNGAGDETPADRVVTFVAMSGEGFRSFRVGALLKIG